MTRKDVSPTLSPTDKQALDILRSAVAEALDRKQRLGQYAVIWQGGRAVRIEPEDLPHLARTLRTRPEN